MNIIAKLFGKNYYLAIGYIKNKWICKPTVIDTFFYPMYFRTFVCKSV